MAISNKNVYNLNNLSSSGFVLQLDRFPNFTFTVQDVNLPGVQTTAVPIKTPLGRYFKPGDELQYQTLVSEFIVDETLNNWREIYNWMRALSPVKMKSYDEPSTPYEDLLREGLVTTGSLYILTNSLNINLKVTFVDMFPIFLDGLNFSTRSSDNETLTAKATFVYSYYNIEYNNQYNSVAVANNVIS